MNSRTFLILVTAAVIGLGSLFFQTIYKKHIIFLKDHSEIIADETWIVDKELFYRHKSEIKSIAVRHIQYVKRGGSFDAESAWILTRRLWTSTAQKGSELLPASTPGKVSLRNWIIFIGAALLVIFVMMIVFSKLKHTLKNRQAARRIRSEEQPKPKKKRKHPPKPHPRSKKEEVVYEGREAVVQFFLNIFKFQKGVPDAEEALFRPVETNATEGNDIYELRVRIGDEWASRRMTIGPIGEESGSRSTCYYVIFDDHLVVKIPPVPVTKFKQYLLSIKRDNEIAEKLQPKECLIPRISVILKKIHPFYDDEEPTPENLEEKYIEWLKNNDEFQAFLKIGGSFAYFMDLSKYFFLGNTLKTIHNVKSKIADEMGKHPGIIWNSVEFEARYGPQHVLLADNLHPVYTLFESRVRHTLQENHMSSEISAFQIKEWFLAYLAGGHLTRSDFDTKPGISSELNTVANRILKEQWAAVDPYRQMIQAYVVTKSLQQHKTHIANLITNLIDLLVWLFEKQIAMRDLKPDNLLIAGDPSKYPQFLESAALFSIGLIDVETAVWFGEAETQNIKQPPLGGTPSFSTPSHLLRNEILELIFKDLPTILHLQDWYAAIGMIYTVVTGERLFDRTAKTLLNLKADIKERAKKKMSPLEILGTSSQTFWKEAHSEFESRMRQNEKRLSFVHVMVTKGSKKLLADNISDAQQSLLTAIQQLVETQQIFKGEKIRKSLVAAPHLKISHFKVKFMNDQAKNLTPEEKKAAIGILEELLFLKQLADRLTSVFNALQRPAAIVSTHDLLHSMFVIVLDRMHQRCWKPLLP